MLNIIQSYFIGWFTLQITKKSFIKILFLFYYCCSILFPFLAGNRRLHAKGKLSFNNFQTFLAAPAKKMQQLQLYSEENKRSNK